MPSMLGLGLKTQDHIFWSWP